MKKSRYKHIYYINNVQIKSIALRLKAQFIKNRDQLFWHNMQAFNEQFLILFWFTMMYTKNLRQTTK